MTHISNTITDLGAARPSVSAEKNHGTRITYTCEEMLRIRASMPLDSERPNTFTDKMPEHLYASHKHVITPTVTSKLFDPFSAQKPVPFITDEDRSSLAALRERMREMREQASSAAPAAVPSGAFVAAPPSPIARGQAYQQKDSESHASDSFITTSTEDAHFLPTAQRRTEVLIQGSWGRVFDTPNAAATANSSSATPMEFAFDKIWSESSITNTHKKSKEFVPPAVAVKVAKEETFEMPAHPLQNVAAPWWISAWPFAPYYTPVIIPIPHPVLIPEAQQPVIVYSGEANEEEQVRASKPKPKRTQSTWDAKTDAAAALKLKQAKEIAKTTATPLGRQTANASDAPPKGEKKSKKNSKPDSISAASLSEPPKIAATIIYQDQVCSEAKATELVAALSESADTPQATAISEKEKKGSLAPNAIQTRRRQIQYGVRTRGYQVWHFLQRYISDKRTNRLELPDKLTHSLLLDDVDAVALIELAKKVEPKPEPKQQCSKRAWEAAVRRWRRSLHTLDAFLKYPSPKEKEQEDIDGLGDDTLENAGERVE